MTDKSLLNELKQLQELSEEEAEAISGGNLALSQNLIKLPRLGGCPACTSGLPPFKTPYLDIALPF